MSPDPKHVRSIAVCGKCGPDKGIATFVLKIYACGNYRAHCFVCDEAWEALSGGETQDAKGDEAVG